MTSKAEIQQRLDAATDGPWIWQPLQGSRNPIERSSLFSSAPMTDPTVIDPDGDHDEHWLQVDPCNADLIANAPTDLSWCLERITTLTEALALFAARESAHYPSKGYNHCWKCGEEFPCLVERARALLEAQ